MKHIYKYALEGMFFQLMISDNEIEKGDMEGVPVLTWKEDSVTTTTWTYETEEQRDNDYNVVINAYHLLKVYRT
jgi:hypothetical protein